MTVRLLSFLPLFMLMLLSPLITGLIRKIKNNLRMRKGAPLLQPYKDMRRLFQKEDIIPETSSWVFKIAPAVCLASTVIAFFLIPSPAGRTVFSSIPGLITLVFVLAAGRFFVALAALDTGSSFGGMGASREMFISSLCEPVLFISFFVIILSSGHASPSSAILHPALLSLIVASVAIFLVMIAETSRIPIDNRETHLELTMIHEAMVLEYTGSALAFIELAGHLRQALFFSLIATFMPPYIFLGSFVVAWVLKIVLIIFIVAVMEILFAKMRLFRVPDLYVFGAVLAVCSLVLQAGGM